jgi:hypothetical protein
MFSWFRSKRSSAGPPPSTSSNNPGAHVRARVSLGRGGKGRVEEVDAVDVLARVLKKQGHAVTKEETWPQAGFEFRKQYVVLHSLRKHPPGTPQEDRR